MLICKQCGKDNELGRVFCASCGAKLDLDGMSSDVVADAVQRGGWFGRNWGKIVWIVVLIFLVIIGLAAWSNTKPIGKPASKGGRIVEGSIMSFSRLRQGQRLGRKFTEEDINAFLALKAEQWNLESFSVSLGDGRCDVHIVKSILPQGITISSYKLDPKMSYDLICVPSGGKLVAWKASFGHLPLGPFKSMVVGKIAALLSEDKDWKALEAVTEIKVTSEGVELFAKK
ncbi:MAG: hypothetical protein JXN60_01190 [Lentisphaerae bacterium]|nr:hypothetical protein [Lentisphaerota bacterium]